MGTYMMKVTSKTVELANGETANVAVFAYKPYTRDTAANARMHFTSGAGTCDRMADEGKRTGWVVHGFKSAFGDPSAPISINPRAYKLPHGPLGSYEDSWLDSRVSPWRSDAIPLEMSEVVKVGKGMEIDSEQDAINNMGK